MKKVFQELGTKNDISPMSFADNAICSAGEDLLNRTAFARTIANYLLSWNNKDGFVISINGPWGSGKTSIANLVKQEIRERSLGEKTLKSVIIDYSPWNALSESGVIQQFFDVLLRHFDHRWLKRLAAAGLIAGDAIIQAISSASPMLKDLCHSFAEFSKSVQSQTGDLECEKRKVEKALRKAETRFYVFVDDLDRLNNHEIRLVIQLIKAVCNFSNITYVLLFDKGIVIPALAGEQGYDGASYLEKIVQAEFEIPALSREDIFEISCSDLRKALGKELYEKNKELFDEYLSHGLLARFETLRNERRFLNSLSFYRALFEGEINLPDLVAITYLRAIDPKVIEVIKNYEGWLVGASSAQDQGVLAKASDAFKESLNNTKCKYALFSGVFDVLFPHQFGFSNIRQYGSDYRNARICARSILHKYINQRFDSSDISVLEIQRAFGAKDENELELTTQRLDDNQSIQFLDALVSYCAELKDIDSIKLFLRFLMKTAPGRGQKPFHKIRKEFYITSLLKYLAKSVSDENADGLFLELANCSDSAEALYSLGTFIERPSEGRLVSNGTKDTIVSKTVKSAVEYIKGCLRDPELPKPGSRSLFNDLLSFLHAHDQEACKGVVELKDDGLMTSFIIRAACYSTMYSGGSISHGIVYPTWLTVDSSVFDADIVERLIRKESSEVKKKYLVAFLMQIRKVPPKEGGTYPILKKKYWIMQLSIICESLLSAFLDI